MSSETPQAGHDQHSLSPNTSASSWLNHGVNENPFLLTRGIYGPPPLPQLLELPRAFYEEPAKLEAHEHAPTKRANIAPIGGGTDDTASKGLNGARSDHAEPIHSDSDMENQLFRDFHGREFNTSNAIYHLPADMEEHERLNIQNRIICLLLGNLYPAENIVEEILKRRDGYTPMILDVGTGSGAWAIDMAIKFPHCKVLGLDLVPPKIGHREIPSNCSFAIQDVNFPLTQFQDTFDLVNCRAVEAGIHDWRSFTYNIAQIMRPGALLLVGTGNSQCLDENLEPCRVITEGETGFRWMQKMFSILHEASCHRRGSDWPPLLWQSSVEQNPNYAHFFCQQMLLPIGNWLPANSPAEHQYAAELTRYNFINMFKSLRPMFKHRGYSEALIDHWREQTSKELYELKVHTTAVWSWMWCRRTADQWSPIPQDLAH